MTRQEIAANYQTLLTTIVQQKGAIDAIVYLWALEDRSLLKDYSILASMLQGIAAGKIAVKHILLAAQWPTQKNDPNLERCYAESWIGFERSLKLILPGVQLRAVYEEIVQQPTGITEWTNRIWAELNSAEKDRCCIHKGSGIYSKCNL
ncbi:hypothetical protein [Paraflavitalea speifideaquila]|uniref:hypothetical protein n=1 Tax=Paraflavitalea speifideaquila TaxID=3076558 RepID=UPI0028E6C7CA|nr:hypothetical protein [Paraflavitalea speifideiaquila]